MTESDKAPRPEPSTKSGPLKNELEQAASRPPSEKPSVVPETKQPGIGKNDLPETKHLSEITTPSSPPPFTEADSVARPQKQSWTLMDALTLLLVVVGFLTVGMMMVQSYQMNESIRKTAEANQIAQTALAASQRAWIGPQELKITEDELDKTAVRFEVFYRNVGREPATKIWRNIQVFTTIESVKQPQIDKSCDIATPEASGSLIAYPSEQMSYRGVLTVSNFEKAPQEVLGVNKAVYVFGCFSYETVGERHTSRFCFRVSPKKDLPIKNWPWVFCPTGNDGD